MLSQYFKRFFLSNKHQKFYFLASLYFLKVGKKNYSTCDIAHAKNLGGFILKTVKSKVFNFVLFCPKRQVYLLPFKKTKQLGTNFISF